MYFTKGNEPNIPTEHEETLRKVKFDASGPGTILHDFNMLLDYIKDTPPPLTAASQLSGTVLPDINARLKHPIQTDLKRPQPKSYPQILGLYLLVRASGIANSDETGKTHLLRLDAEMYQQWTGLNPTEQYCILVETWFLRGKLEIIGERHRAYEYIPLSFSDTASFYFHVPLEGLPVAGNGGMVEDLKYSPGAHNLGLLELFGLINIEHGQPEPGAGWQIKAIYRTALGDALLTVLYAGFFKDVENVFRFEDEAKPTIGAFQPILQPYFADWKHNLTASKWAFRAGAYTFKVTLGSAWCRIAIDAHALLDDIAAIILQSVDFDSDHLYEFTYKNRFGAQEDIGHPYMEDMLQYTSDVSIGDLSLRIGQTMTFLFDFGDNWKFKVSLEQVTPNEIIRVPKVLEKHGKAPEQYPSWDE